MSIVLGVLVAACFGTGDFLGGLATRRLPTLISLGIAQAVALVGAVVLALVAAGELRGEDVVLGIAAGLLNVTGLGCLYRGLAIGRIGVVAPLTAVIASTIPVGWGLLVGERPGPVALVGVVLAIVAAALISTSPDRSVPTTRISLLLAVGGGTAFGLSFICYVATSEESGMWPVLTARGAALVGVLVVGALVRPSLEVPREPGLQAASAGILDVVAAALLLVAARNGLASTVAPVAALGPAFTVGHARWFLRERSTRVQIVGLLVALAGLVLIAAGGSA